MEKQAQFIKEFSKEESPEKRQQVAQTIKAKRAEHFAEKLSTEQATPVLQEAKKMLGNFYKEQKEKWTKSEYTKEDITKYFSEENLASLTLGDYILLLRRFPGEMVTHVTRQGIRDHVGMIYHRAGEGAYAEGFTKIVEDGRLRSPLGVYLAETEKKQAVARFLHLDDFKGKKEATEYIFGTIIDGRQGEPGSYADRMALHFAAEEVADYFYGSEQGNEIFIVYPAAYIASQYYFNGQLNKSRGDEWNDQWVWANEERGMDLNAGIVFIPEEAKVDKKTGSRYELDDNRNPIKNSEYHNAFRKVFDSVHFVVFAQQVIEIRKEISQSQTNPYLASNYQERLNKLEPFRQRLEQEFRITDLRLQSAILNYDNLHSLITYKKMDPDEEKRFHMIDGRIEGALKEEGIYYLEANDAISSKEFWEAYFAKNPSKRPTKIVYYKGADTTGAFRQWRMEQGIDKKVDNGDMGFSERHIERSAPRATVGLDRFRILAEQVIEDHFLKA